MSQLAYPGTPLKQRRQEADAIYHILRMIVREKDQKA